MAWAQTQNMTTDLRNCLTSVLVGSRAVAISSTTAKDRYLRFSWRIRQKCETQSQPCRRFDEVSFFYGTSVFTPHRTNEGHHYKNAMSSTSSRRISYHMAHAGSSARMAREFGTTEHQPSSQASITLRHLRDCGDNNQEEESTIEVSPNILKTSVEEKDRKSCKLHSLRRQATFTKQPAVTRAQLRKENAALKLRLSELANQHETETQRRTTILTQVVQEHEDIEIRLKQQIMNLEKRLLEASENAQNYQHLVKILQRLLCELRSQTQEKQHPTCLQRLPSEFEIKTPLIQPKHYNGSRVSNKFSSSSGANPFASLENVSHCSPPSSNKVFQLQASYTPYRPCGNTTITNPVGVVNSRDNNPQKMVANSEYPSPSSLPVPLSVREDQRLLCTPSKTKSSGGVIAYYTDILAAKLAVSEKLKASPSMKVMPAWKFQQHQQHQQCPTSGPSVPVRANVVSPGDFTAITIL